MPLGGHTAFQHRALLRVVAIAVAISACAADRAMGPQATVLIIHTATDGHDYDANGYHLVIGSRTIPVSESGTLIVTDIPPADYPVLFTNLAPNCTADQDNPSVIRLALGDTTVAAFGVHCTATLNGRLIFSTNRDGNWEIYSIRADGSDPVNLTMDPAWDAFPAVDVVRDLIYFASYREGGLAIYQMKPDGSAVTFIVEGTGPAISPDGTQLAFMSWYSNGEILLLRLDSSGVTNLTNTPLRWEGLPDWSPDGTRIAFVAHDSVGERVYVMSADGSGVTPIVADRAAVWPRWSPDGTGLVFSGYQQGDSLTGDLGWEIYRVNLDGSASNRLLRNPGDDTEPSWSRDGLWIAFESASANGAPPDISIMSAGGGLPRSLTGHIGDNATPRWGRP